MKDKNYVEYSVLVMLNEFMREYVSKEQHMELIEYEKDIKAVRKVVSDNLKNLARDYSIISIFTGYLSEVYNTFKEDNSTFDKDILKASLNSNTFMSIPYIKNNEDLFKVIHAIFTVVNEEYDDSIDASEYAVHLRSKYTVKLIEYVVASIIDRCEYSDIMDIKEEELRIAKSNSNRLIKENERLKENLAKMKKEKSNNNIASMKYLQNENEELRKNNNKQRRELKKLKYKLTK